MSFIERISPYLSEESFARELDRVEEIERLRTKALHFYNESSLPNFIDKYSLIFDGKIIEGRDAMDESEELDVVEWPKIEESVIVTVLWEQTRLNGKEYEHTHNAIGIETYPDGTVCVYGGNTFDSEVLIGKSITRKEWKHNRKLQESIIKSAFKNPFVLSDYTGGDFFVSLSDLT